MLLGDLGIKARCYVYSYSILLLLHGCTCVTNMPSLFIQGNPRGGSSQMCLRFIHYQVLLLRRDYCSSVKTAYYIYLQQPAKPQCWRWVILGHFISFKSLPVLLLYGTCGLPLVFNPVHNIQAVPASKVRLTASIIFTIIQPLPKSGLCDVVELWASNCASIQGQVGIRVAWKPRKSTYFLHMYQCALYHGITYNIWHC